MKKNSSFKEQVEKKQQDLRKFIEEDNLDGVKRVLKDDAIHVNWKDEDGNTALHYAATFSVVNRSDVIKDYLKAVPGSKYTNITNNNGDTPADLERKMNITGTAHKANDEILDVKEGVSSPKSVADINDDFSSKKKSTYDYEAIIRNANPSYNVSKDEKISPSSDIPVRVNNLSGIKNR